MHNYISTGTQSRRSIILPPGPCKCTAYIPTFQEDKEHLNASLYIIPALPAATVRLHHSTEQPRQSLLFPLCVFIWWGNEGSSEEEEFLPTQTAKQTEIRLAHISTAVMLCILWILHL